MITPEQVLAHFGVKGMKWGIRRREETSKVPDGETVPIQKKPGTKVYADGGKKVPAHDDAIKTAISKQKAKNSTTDSLSTKELQELVNRMNLEQQYAKLTNPQNQKNKLSIKEGMKVVNQVLEAKKAYNKLMEDPFINEAVNNVKEDLGINNLTRKAVKKGADQVYKPH